MQLTASLLYRTRLSFCHPMHDMLPKVGDISLKINFAALYAL
jgi:hypothetical protein